MFSISIIERALDFGASVPNRAGHADRHAAHVAVGFDFVHAFAGAAPVSKPGESHGAPANGANVVQLRYSPMSRPNNHKIKIELG